MNTCPISKQSLMTAQSMLNLYKVFKKTGLNSNKRIFAQRCSLLLKISCFDMSTIKLGTLFNDISGDKTAIYISHRLSSCKFCDEITVFHKGTVIQQGTHAELVADEAGKYYELWNAQAKYYTK